MGHTRNSKRQGKRMRRKSERRDLQGTRRSPHKYRDSRPVRGPCYFPPDLSDRDFLEALA